MHSLSTFPGVYEYTFSISGGPLTTFNKLVVVSLTSRQFGNQRELYHLGVGGANLFDAIDTGLGIRCSLSDLNRHNVRDMR